MPTPFYHLKLAQDLLQSPNINWQLMRFLESQRAAFFFGNLAPDVQMFSHQVRAETHFFDLPLKSTQQLPWEKIFDIYPQLRADREMPPAQLAFVAGYLCHLQADWLWISKIFVPIFGLKSDWGTFPERLTLHNVLRAYLDQQAIDVLTEDIVAEIVQVTELDWLPFVTGQHLLQWRDFLCQQLQPGGKVNTVEVFAGRQGISPNVFDQFIESEDNMDHEIFSHVSKDDLNAYRQQVIQGNLSLICEYLAPASLQIEIGGTSHENYR